MTMEPYEGVTESELVDMLLEDGDLTKEAAVALINHVHRTMDSAYRSIIVLVYGRAWLALKMSGPLELLDRVLNGRALKLSVGERKKIIRLLDTTGLTREQISRAVGLDRPPQVQPRGNGDKGVIPGKVPKSIKPEMRQGVASGQDSWLRSHTHPFLVAERRVIERRLSDLITPSSRARGIRSLTAAAGHLAAACGVEQRDQVTSEILLQAASLKGILMDEALLACYLPEGEVRSPWREEKAFDALARWYIAWLAAGGRGN